MISPLRLLRRQRLRVRITLAFTAVAIVLTVVLSVSTYVAVRAFLERQRVSSATRQTVFGLLFARSYLGQHPGDLQSLVSLLQSREDFDAMVTTPQDWISTTLSLTPRAVPGGLRTMVAGEHLGYQYATVEGTRTLVFGAPLPPAGTNLYLFYSLRGTDQTLSLLARVLLFGGLAMVLLAVGLAQRMSNRILRPLVGVSEAAQQVASGLLETRVQARSRDELGALASSFNQMASALQGMIERERRFVAGVSHELRTPLSALQATSELLVAARDELPEERREVVDMVHEEVVELRRLVEELLEVSELDAGRARARWESVDLRALSAAVAAKRRVAVEVTGEEVRTWADKARLERILGNLIDNAFEHGEGREVRVEVAGNGRSCELRVSDRGPGIAPGDLPHLFERFFKTDRSRTRERGGIGLGLAIAMQNARLLGGTVEATSEVGSGSTFTLRLPVRTEPPEDPQ